MKKLLLILIVLFFVNSYFAMVYSQELSVASFEHVVQDLYASTHLRTDVNGNPCAVLKVQIPGLDNIKFEGWIINQSYTPGEYIVYVPAGTKKIIIKHPSFFPLEYQFPEKIEEKATYKVILQVPANTEGNVVVNIKTNSLNARLNFDGQIYNTDNAQFVILTTAGNHSVKISTENKEMIPFEGYLSVSDDAFQEFSCKMVSNSHYNVRFTAEKNIQIYVDGTIENDIKNNSFTVTSGVHDIDLRIEDGNEVLWYRQTKINGVSGDVIEDFSLSGYITFAYPKNAKFKIVPATETSLKPSLSSVATGQEIRLLGDYDVTVTKKGYYTRTVRITVGVNEKIEGYRVSLSSKADELEREFRYEKAYSAFSKMADNNDEYAWYKLGGYFNNGWTPTKVKDNLQAITCWKIAADAGSIESMLILQDQPISTEEKILYLTNAANLGSIEAKYKLGEYCYANGNYPEAMNCFMDIQKVKPTVNYYIGEMYYKGYGVDRNVQIAKSYYDIGSCADDERCAERIADYVYEQGKKDEACNAYLKLYKLSNIAKVRVAEWYYQKEEYLKAARQLVDIDASNMKSISDLSKLYCLIAHKVYNVDKTLAVNLYEIYLSQFEKEDISVYYRVGLYYEKTIPYKAVEYYQKGTDLENKLSETDKSDLNHISSQCRLGYCYEVGSGISQDYSKAVDCYKGAIKNGYIGAYRYLGTMYANGYGVDKNINEAIKYWKLGADKGDQSAIKQLIKYYKHKHNDAQVKKWESKLKH